MMAVWFDRKGSSLNDYTVVRLDSFLSEISNDSQAGIGVGRLVSRNRLLVQPVRPVHVPMICPLYHTGNS